MGNFSSKNGVKNVDTSSDPVLERIERIMPEKTEENTNVNDTDVNDTIGTVTEVQKKEQNEENKVNEEGPVEQVGGFKKQIPLLGGFDIKSYLSESSENFIGGFENRSGRKRYTKYDLFKILRNLDLETETEQKGGNNDKNVNTESSLNDNESMEHIKNIILKELETLKKNK
jgi:hypothetical protein